VVCSAACWDAEPADRPAGSADVIELLLLRHAESTWNVERRWSGQSDPPLSDRGRAQTREFAQQLPKGHYTGVVTSDLARARETGEIIAEALGLPAPREVSGLRERDTGAWTAKTETEIEEAWPGWLDRRSRGELKQLPDGEPEAAFDDRIVAAVLDVAAAEPSGPVIVVAHSGALRALQRRYGVSCERGNLQGVRLAVDGDSIRQLEPEPWAPGAATNSKATKS
jgi:broad specificity phosphatase PhoE